MKKLSCTFQGIRRDLLQYYTHHQRPLPWRQCRDPYAIWLSEIMLQQTQVETVLARFDLFLQRFPTIKILAQARCEEVCEAWAGLGYYRRAKHLHAAAQIIISKHQGKLPKDMNALLALPGIGRYTAGAIGSIAFGMHVPLVDGNVERLLSRLFALKVAEKPEALKSIWQWASQLIAWNETEETFSPGDVNQAMMDLGATLCTPQAPKCLLCPLKKHCLALQEGQATSYPRWKKFVKKQTLHLSFALAKSQQGLWLVRRNLHGLWPGLWEPPSQVGHEILQTKEDFRKAYGIVLGEKLLEIKHALTHRHVIASVYLAKSWKKLRTKDDMRCFADPCKQAALSTLAKKAIQQGLLALED